MKIKIVKIFLFLNMIITGHSQLDSLYEVFADHIETDHALFEILEQMMECPMDINCASKQDLEILPFLSADQIHSILKERPFRKKVEIKNIVGSRTYKLFRHFFMIGHKSESLNINCVHRMKYPLEGSIVARQNGYSGSPVETYNRIKINKGKNFSGGILNQKDIGEESFTDHLSGYIQWENKKLGHRFLLGSYHLNFGEGLAFSSPYQFGKSSCATLPFRNKFSSGRPFLSAMENHGFLGILSNYSFTNYFMIRGFYSYSLKDANVDKNTKRISGINDTGYHRNESEEDNYNVLRERSRGFIWSYSRDNSFALGFALCRADYNPPVYPKEQDKISTINLYSVSYRKKIKKIMLSGEITRNKISAYAQQHGFLISEDLWSFGVKWWNISKGYRSPFGKSFTGGSLLSHGRRGLYMGISGEINDKVLLNSYWNFQKELWSTFFNPLPVGEKEYLLQTDWKYNLNMNIILRYQYMNNEFYPAEIDYHINEIKNKIRIQINRKISQKTDSRTRVEIVYISYPCLYSKKKGINLYQDIGYSFSDKIQLKARFSSFSTSDYKARIYEYENDIPGTYSNYPLYGKGNKWYILLKYSPLEKIHLWFKYRKIFFSGIESTGSGFEQIQGDTKQTVSFQVNYMY